MRSILAFPSPSSSQLRLDGAPQTGTPREPVASTETAREPVPFVVTPLQILQMATACLSAQQIADALDRDVSIEEKRKQVRHDA